MATLRLFACCLAACVLSIANAFTASSPAPSNVRAVVSMPHPRMVAPAAQPGVLGSMTAKVTCLAKSTAASYVALTRPVKAGVTVAAVAAFSYLVVELGKRNKFGNLAESCEVGNEEACREYAKLLKQLEKDEPWKLVMASNIVANVD